MLHCLLSWNEGAFLSMLVWPPLAGKLLWCSSGEWRSVVGEIISLPLSAWVVVGTW